VPISILIVLGVLAVLGHGYLWVDLVNKLHAWPGNRKLVDRMTLLCFLAFLWLPLGVVASWGEFELGMFKRFYPSPFWVRAYFLTCVLAGLYKLIANRFYSHHTDNPKTVLQWRQEEPAIAAQLTEPMFHGRLANWLSKVPGNQALQLTVDHKRLAVPRLAASHEGLKIAHISDLHMTGRYDKKWYEVVADQVNRLQADAIMITGDIVEKQACWPWLSESLGKLQARLGVYFVLGNHDFYIDVDHTRKLLEDQGLVSLSGRWLETEWNGAAVVLAGNEQPWGPPIADLNSISTKDADRLPFKLTLLHTPDQFTVACDQDTDLVLAGHTHGGQIRFPLLGPIVCPSRYGTRYACGVFHRGNTVMHVSRGIAGKTPLRWNCPPEIALLELVPA